MDFDPSTSNKLTALQTSFVSLKPRARHIEATRLIVPNATSLFGVISGDAIPIVSAFIALTEIQQSAILAMPEVDLVNGLKKLAPKKQKEVEPGLSQERKCLRHSSHPQRSSSHGSPDEESELSSLDGSDDDE